MSPEAVDLSTLGQWDWDKLLCEIGKAMRGLQEEKTIPGPPHDEWIMFTCHYFLRRTTSDEDGSYEFFIDGLSASPSGTTGNSGPPPEPEGVTGDGDGGEDADAD